MQSLGVFFAAVMVLTLFVSYSQGQLLPGLAIVAAMALGFGWIVKRGVAKEQIEGRVREALDLAIANAGFLTGKKFLAADYKTILAIDEQSRRICLVENDNGLSNEPTPGSIRSQTYGIDDLLQSQVVADGVKGGRVKRLSLDITVNDKNRPVFSLVLIVIDSLGLSRQTPLYKQALAVGNHWQGLLTELKPKSPIDQ